MNRILQVFYIFFSASLLSLAIPNEIYSFGSPFIALLSLIPLYITYENFKSYREAFLLTALHTTLVHLMSSFWLAYFKDFAIFTLGASAVGTGFIGGCTGLFLYLPFSSRNSHIALRAYSPSSCRHSISFRMIWFALIYTLWEWVKSNGFLGYPWGTISSAMFRWRIFIQIADITGTYGITFLAALFAAVCGQGFILMKNLRCHERTLTAYYFYFSTAVTCGVLFLSTFIYGTVRYVQPRHPIKYLNTVMVQQNYDPWQSSSDDNSILASEKLTEEKVKEVMDEGGTVDLAVWSEGCLKYAFPNSEAHYRIYPKQEPLIPFINRMEIPFLLGGPYLASQDPRNYMNAALLFDREGNFRGAYGKNHLVPFAEVIPGSNIPFVRNLLKKVVGISAGFVPGDQYVYFDIQGHNPKKRILPPVKVVSLKKSAEEQRAEENERPYVRISTPICFGDAFPDVCRPLFRNGSELFMNITDDSWSKTKSAEYQHFVIAAYRAIELRTTLARSTNAGYSAVVNPAGKIIADMPLFESGAMFCYIPVYSRVETVYLKFGNWFPHLILIFALFYCILVYKSVHSPDDVPSERKPFRRKQKKFRKKKLKK